jgi:hypothetical protein
LPVWLAQLGSFAAQALTQFVNIYIRDACSGRAVAAVSADMRGNSDESWSRTPIGSFAIVCSHPATKRANPLLAGVLAPRRGSALLPSLPLVGFAREPRDLLDAPFHLMRSGESIGLSYSLHAFGFLALLIEFSCATQRDACLTCIAKRSGTRRCLASSGFAHRRCRRMLTRRRCGRRLALSGLAHDRRWGMLGGCAGCPLLRRGRLARGLTTHVLGRRCLALSRLAHGGGRGMLA